MARSSIQLATTTTLFFFIYIQITAALLSRSAMVFPLTFSTLKFSGTPSYGRRHPRRPGHRSNPAARMRVYDGLTLTGYYTARVWIGTPPQTFALIVDTGSTVTYVPCSTCKHCGKHQDPYFQPDQSTTYRPIECNMECVCDEPMLQCLYDVTYTERSTTRGVLGEDVLSFGDQSGLSPQRAVFGCEMVETGMIYFQSADGVIGLGRGHDSIVDQLVDRGVISNSFSLCFGGMDIGGGAMVLGGISPPADMIFTHSDPMRSLYYNIELKEMHIAGKQLPLNPRVFDRDHGTILDSGTTYAYLPEAAFIAFRDAIMEELNSLKLIHGPDPDYDDICFSDVGSDVSQLSETFPVVDLVFGNGNKLSLPPENYLFRHPKTHDAYCLGIFPNAEETTLLGGIIFQNTLVMYDREHLKIGFWKTNCSEIWERLHPSTSLPAVSSALNKENSTEEITPSESRFSTLPDDIIIGFITFDMLLSIMPSRLKPLLSRLSAYIAHGLDLDISQVHLLNITYELGYSVVKWAIYPVSSGDYISRASAVNIIAGIVEHRVRLPSSFGNYQMFDWRIEPPERTWWQQHHLAVAVTLTISSVLVLGLLGFGLWSEWKQRRRSFGTYKPVSYFFPEQELQAI